MVSSFLGFRHKQEVEDMGKTHGNPIKDVTAMQPDPRYHIDLNSEPLDEYEDFHSNQNYVEGQLIKAQDNKGSSKKPKLNMGQSSQGLTSKFEVKHVSKLIFVKCNNCYVHVLVRDDDPKCPNCHHDSSKKRKLNEIKMDSMKGINNSSHVIPSLTNGVYMPGSNNNKKANKQGDSSSASRQLLNHGLTSKSEIEDGSEFIFLRCINCSRFIMVHDGNPKCAFCHKSLMGSVTFR